MRTLVPKAPLVTVARRPFSKIGPLQQRPNRSSQTRARLSDDLREAVVEGSVLKGSAQGEQPAALR